MSVRIHYVKKYAQRSRRRQTKQRNFLPLLPHTLVMPPCGDRTRKFPLFGSPPARALRVFFNTMNPDTHSRVSSRNDRILPSQPSNSPLPHVFETSETCCDKSTPFCKDSRLLLTSCFSEYAISSGGDVAHGNSINSRKNEWSKTVILRNESGTCEFNCPQAY